MHRNNFLNNLILLMNLEAGGTMKIDEITIKYTNVTNQELCTFYFNPSQRFRLFKICIFMVTEGGKLIKILPENYV